GSDEILAGYPKHAFEPLVAAYQAVVPAGLHRSLIEPLIDALPFAFRRAKTAAAAFGLRDPHERFPRWFGALSPAECSTLAQPAASRASAADGLPFAAPAGASPLRRILAFDQTSWLPDNLLERGDRMTMAASIEARMPFLDPELTAYVSKLPDRFRLRGFTGKWLLRQAMRRLLPAAILSRPKVGFRVPVSEWFRGSMRGYVHDHLLGTQSATRAYYDAARLKQVVDEHAAGRQNHEKLLWTLLSLELFHRVCLTPVRP
ncbi:MAG TPA: asparagine synthase C-terminal domain-containing protein, partial [Candidatus Cybelea sp.]|nr:asparagine synthase C-terminal domain-containing protein [Candidatus Cybelea sp.]